MSDHFQDMEIKAKLRFTTLESIFKLVYSSSFPQYISDLFNSLIKYDDVLEKVLEMIQMQQNVIVLTEIFKLLHENFKKNEKKLDEDFSKKALQAVLNCLEKNTAQANSKNDHQIMQLVFQASLFSSLMSNYLIDLLHPMPTNQYILSYLLITTSYSPNYSSLIPLVEQFLTPKLTLCPCSYGTLYVMSTQKEIGNGPSLKSLIGYFKSLSDKAIFEMLTPVILEALMLRLSPTALKEIPTVFSFLPGKIRYDSKNVFLFSSFVEKVLELPDSLSVIKPNYEQILKLYISNIRSENKFDINIEDTSLLINSSIGNAFCQLIDKFSINPFESFLISNIENKTNNVILMSIYIIEHTSHTNYLPTTFDLMINTLKSYIEKSSITNQLFMHLCGKIISHFESKTALSALIQGLDNNSQLASNILRSNTNFSFIFSNIARSFKPGKSSPLFISTLKDILEANISQPEFSAPQSDTDSRSCSDSTNFDIPDFERLSTVLPDSVIETAPTDATVLFCSLLSSLHQYPDLFDLLPYSASSISISFSSALMKDFPNPHGHKFIGKVLSSLGNALQCLDVADIYSLSQTFLMILPGQAMLFLAITLQRLPRSIIISSLSKTLPFLLGNPDEAGRMVALISYSHPDIAMNFIDTIISGSALKKKTFFIFKSSESNEQALIVLYKIIGYCSIFLTPSFFSSTFLTFSTQILNKYLTHQSRSPELYAASLFAIRKLSLRIQVLQEEKIDHVFPFKDFLVQYVCSYYLDLGDIIISDTNINSNLSSSSSSLISSGSTSNNTNNHENLLINIPQILNALSSLIPLRPIRPYDRHEKSVELTAVMLQVATDDYFEYILNSSKTFYNTLIDCNTSINVFIRIVMPLSPALLIHPEWVHFCNLMEFVCGKWRQLNIQQSSDILSQIISKIGILISYTLPLTLKPEVKEKSVNIIFSLVSLQCSIRNQILSLPQSIRPDKPNTSELDVHETNSAICTFLAKHFTTSQTFDVILTMINFFEELKLLKTHHIGVAECIKILIRDRGSEDFRFDGKIVQSLVDTSSDKDESVLAIFIGIIEVLLRMRLFSMLSNIIPLNNKISEPLFNGILNSILKIENGGKQLLNVIANFFTNDEQEDAAAFTCRSLPFLADSMKFIDDDCWTKIFLRIASLKQKIDDPLIKCMVGNEQYDGYMEFAKIVARDHLLSLQVLLASFPESPNNFYIKLSISLAAASPETCEAFLNYAISSMLRKSTCFSAFSMMQQIFEAVDNQYWISLSESLSALFIQNMRCNDKVVDCTIAFTKNIGDEQLQEFWQNFVEICGANVEKWINIICKLFEEANVDLKVLAQILPELFVHLDDNLYKHVISIISSQLEIQPSHIPEQGNDDQTIYDMCSRIMNSSIYENSKELFLKSFVTYIKEKRYIKICSHLILNLCQTLNNDNLFAFTALVEQIKFFEDDNTSEIIDIIMRLLN